MAFIHPLSCFHRGSPKNQPGAQRSVDKENNYLIIKQGAFLGDFCFFFPLFIRNFRFVCIFPFSKENFQLLLLFEAEHSLRNDLNIRILLKGLRFYEVEQNRNKGAGPVQMAKYCGGLMRRKKD